MIVGLCSSRRSIRTCSRLSALFAVTFASLLGDARAAEYSTLGLESKDCQNSSPSISVDHSTAVVGGMLTINVTSRPNSFVQVATTAHMQNVNVTGIYVPMFDINVHVLPSYGTNFYSVITDSSGAGTVTFPLPAASTTPWTEFTFQAVTANSACTSDRFSTSAAKIATIRPVPGPSSQRTSITKNGITWSFSSSRPTGQFANGDYWVVGPVTITSITPGTVTGGGVVRNGSMLNPMPNSTCEIGYGSDVFGGGFNNQANGASRYNASMNVGLNLPLTIQANNSLVSTIGNTSTSGLADAAVLTVLSEPAPADAFRPPYSGTDKTLRFGVSRMDMSRYKNLPPPANAPSLSSLLPKLDRPVLRHCQDWVHYLMQVTANNTPRYYRDRDSFFNTAVGLLNTSAPASDKLELAKKLMQIGIDYHGLVLAGQTYNCTTGHCNGFPFPIINAGYIFRSAQMFWIAKLYNYNFRGPNHPLNRHDGFPELGQYFTVEVTGTTSSGALIKNWGYGNFSDAFIGAPEWGNFHSEEDDNLSTTAPGGIVSDDYRWDEGPDDEHPQANPYRNCCSANGHVGMETAARIMEIEEAFDNPAFFKYMDRYVAIQPDGAWTEIWDPVTRSLRSMYRTQFNKPGFSYNGPLLGTYNGPYP